MGIDKVDGPDVLKDLDPSLVKVTPNVTPVAGIRRHTLAMGQHSRQVDLRGGSSQAKTRPRRPVPGQSSSSRKGSHWCRATVEAAATNFPSLKQTD